MLQIKLFLTLIFLYRADCSKYQELQRLIISENLFRDVEDLTSDLLSKTQPGHCYAIITDTMYQAVLEWQIFFEIRGHPIYILKIEDYEDLLEPEDSNRRFLEEIRKIGCGVYLILLANGIQMKRFLQFGDETRILNTRAKFIILHDYRLFAPDIHYLWKRYVNIVFIRQYERNSKNKNVTGSLFELTTVPFPISFKGIFVAKQIDLWRSGRYRYGNSLFTDKTYNLNGATMNVVYLEHTPAVLKISDSEMIGLEVQILKALTQVMNFKTVFYKTEDTLTEKWGRKLENDTLTGLIRHMHEGKADFALADLHHTPYYLDLMDLTIPYNSECLTFLTPEAVSDNSWKTLILPFSLGMWIGVLISLFSVGFVFYGFASFYIYLQKAEHVNLEYANLNGGPGIAIIDEKQKTNDAKLYYVLQIPRRKTDIFDSFSNCITYTYSMLMLVSIPRLPLGWCLRILTGWYWIYCLLLVVAYRASMTAILANPVPRLTIDSLDELAKNEKIGCGAWGEQTKEFFLSSLDIAGQTIGYKLEYVDDAFLAVKRIIDGNFAFYENEYFLRELRSQQHNEKVQQTLHIMRECAIHMPISLGLEKNSPIKQRVDKYVRRMIEAGLTNKWLSEAIRSVEFNTETPPQEALMDLKKFYGALVALGVGYSLASITFLGELLYFKFITQRDPMYDKYALK